MLVNAMHGISNREKTNPLLHSKGLVNVDEQHLQFQFKKDHCKISYESRPMSMSR